MARDWEAPLQLDPIVEQWGTGGQARRYDGPDLGNRPEFPPPRAPEPEPVEEITEEEWVPERNLLASVFLAAFAMLAVLAVFAGFYIAHQFHGITLHRAPAGTWPRHPWTGQVFAWLVIGALVVLLARFITSPFRRRH